MSTYGGIRLRLSKLAPGVDLELIDGWIQDVYTDILDQLPWKRSEKSFTIQSPQSYKTGTLAVTQGSATITGTGTAWTAGLNGFMIRIANQGEYYQITVASATSATLDRPYEAPTATDLTYRIDQPIFVMPATCRIIRQVTPLHDGGQPLKIIQPNELNRISVSRNNYGTPTWAVPHFDNFSDPPRLQLELYPVPDCLNTSSAILSWAIDAVFDASPFDPDQTATTLLPWVRDSALIEGVTAKIKRYQENYTGAAEHYKEHMRLVESMAQVNALQRGPQPIRLAPELQRQPRRVGEMPFSKDFDTLVDQ